MPVLTLAIAPGFEDPFGVGVQFEAASTGAFLVAKDVRRALDGYG